MRFWDRYATGVTARRSWSFLVLLTALAAALIGLASGNESEASGPISLPTDAESARAGAALARFPGADTAAAIVVVTRRDGGELTAADRAATTAAVARAANARTADAPATDTRAADARGPEPLVSDDERAALGRVPVDAALSGFQLTDRIDRIRTAANDGLPHDLSLRVTGGPAFGADIANSFSGANITLLAVTALVVAILLVLTYRSPVLWLVPLLVIGAADRAATGVATGLSRATGLTFDGSTSGITSVLVFGAGTNYALLLISRYRDELHRHDDHRRALWHATRRAGPTILASNATVVIALSTLLAADTPSTRSLGALAAAGLVVAAVFVLLGLPPALALCGRRIFWPFVPAADGRDTTETGAWHAVAERVVRRPVLVIGCALAFLGVCAAGLLGTSIGLSQTEKFRVRAESVEGFDALARHFPSGASNPTVIVARADAADPVQRALDASRERGVVGARPLGAPAHGLQRWSVVISGKPASPEAFSTIRSIRTALSAVFGADALVGGGDAEALDARDAAQHDLRTAIPVILAVVVIVLLALLRAIPAALLLVAVTAAGALAALGAGSWLSHSVFGYPGLDDNVPLFAFLFLVALGIDYTIFLVTRAREETSGNGTTGGIVRAVSATGVVITSAGVVLAAVFAVLGVLPLITLTQIGIVVGLGILIDTFLVRTIVIPALFALVGPRIWWPSIV
ncbi:MMPL family transporter [Nocardia sp. CDC159]|uniref:MMPL family transporter n=1 Tax=Nocardia pulmonis TaxID=2951408 RepID=A0A9X2E8B2_9NOCA|nr:MULTISPECIES: MMPL family transporter [Nocardia]MCM6775594.1 MMPL family transporter [Nocardia pulmonis]MCM6787672.1 MMPL family transporter [Nocardia sp. CDC159]